MKCFHCAVVLQLKLNLKKKEEEIKVIRANTKKDRRKNVFSKNRVP
jgi:hypothetical protein